MNTVSSVTVPEGIWRDNEWAAPDTEVYTDIVIGKQASRTKHRNKFVVTIQFMYGDADGSGTEIVVFKETEKPLVIEFLNFLARCGNAYPGGRGGCDDYNHVEGWDKWCSGECEENIPQLDWQGDPACDGAQASFRGATMFWYNSEGVPFLCDLVTE